MPGAMGPTGPAGPGTPPAFIHVWGNIEQFFAGSAGIVLFNNSTTATSGVPSNGFTWTSTNLTVNVAGTYLVSWTAALSSSCALGVTANGTVLAGLSAGASSGRIGTQGIAVLAEGTSLKLEKLTTPACTVVAGGPSTTHIVVGSMTVMRLQ